MTTITVNGHGVIPEAHMEGGQYYVQDASESNYILVHTTEFLKIDHYDDFERLHIKLVEYLGNEVYLCRYEPSDLEAIRALPYVIYANVYHEHFVIDKELKTKTSQPPLITDTQGKHSEPQLHEIYIALHRNSCSPQDIRDHVADLLQIGSSKISIEGNCLHVYLKSSELDRLKEVALLDDVRTIEEIYQSRICCSTVRQDIHFADDATMQTILNSNVGQGEGETVIVTDMGFDLGDENNHHPLFGDRVKIMGRQGKLADKSGHGTHVAGCIAASGASEKYINVQGTAPKAHIIAQSIDDGEGELDKSVIGSGFIKLIKDTYRMDGREACVHCCSWDGFTRPYGILAGFLDQILNEKKDYLVLLPAGNEGSSDFNVGMSTGSLASTKNVLTVGACESGKPQERLDDEIFTPIMALKCGYSDDFIFNFKGNPNNVAGNSSRGPTPEGRCKPDVIAPGSAIYSAKSRYTPLTKDSNRFGDSPDKNWMFSSGTSMAAPLVAGCAAVLRQTLRGMGVKAPPAALLKALIVHGADDLSGPTTRGPTIKPPPDNSQGFGRVNMAASQRTIANGTWRWGGALVQGDSYIEEIKILQSPVDISTKPPINLPLILKATLVYTDEAGKALVNDLNLKVTSMVTKETRRANNGSAYKNNVQSLTWVGISPGLCNLTVEAVQIPKVGTNVDQDFALVWSIDWGAPKQNPEVFNKKKMILGGGQKALDAWVAANPQFSGSKV